MSCLEVNSGVMTENQLALAALLADLDREQLQSLLLELAGQHPHLVHTIEGAIRRRGAQHAASPGEGERAHLPPPDLYAVRGQMSTALHNRPYVTDSGWRFFQLGKEAHDLLNQVWGFIAANQPEAALEILNVMTDECVENWQAIMEDEEGQVLNFVQEELGPAWTEAILSADLGESERDGWTAKLDAWTSELEDYGFGETFTPALQALSEGWDDPALQRILRGEVSEPEPEADEERLGRYVDNQLTTARLNVLERQGRHQEYLHLARARGQVARYTVMLVRQGRAAGAADYGLTHLRRTEDALTLAQTLREAGQPERALRVAEHGLGLEGRKAPLASWLADLAAGVGKQDLAIRAATVAFEEEENLASYLRVQELAGEEWPKRREGLLQRARRPRGYSSHGPVDIFLHEELIDDAITLVDRSAFPIASLVEQVANAAIQTRPDWVIQASRQQAESIINRGKANAYETAASWLRKAKQAYEITGRQTEWEGYIAGLLEQHRRKHKLVPLLEALA